MPIDFDPIRTTGTSSTEEEHSQAIKRAEEVRTFLSENGFTDGILADSGNGAHLLYRIDMENADENRDLIKSFPLALSSMYSDEKVDVDKSVFNATRIWKLYGTLAVKGDDLPDRPHRLSKILDLPTELLPVEIEKIKLIVDFYNTIDKKDKSHFSKSDSSFSVEEFIKKHEIDVYKEKPFGINGKLWVIKCPMNEEHTDKGSSIIQFADGAISAGCHHNSCSSWGWKDLRMKFEPDCYDKKSPKIAPSSQHLEKYHKVLAPQYGIDEDGRLYTMERREENFVKKNLSNFIAVPIEDIVKDDGFQERKYLKIKGFINDEELPDLTINAIDFANMSWITNWGLKANIFSCYGSRDKVRDCTQRLSCFSKKITLFSHLGWKKINDTWSYLHSDGSIGAENINVDLQKDGFDNYTLKNSKNFNSNEIQTAMKKSLELLNLHKDSFIIWGVCYLTPLCEALRQINHEPGFAYGFVEEAEVRKAPYLPCFLIILDNDLVLRIFLLVLKILRMLLKKELLYVKIAYL